MERYEYKLVPTPKRSVNYDGLPKSVDSFAQTLADGMTELGRDGWEFLRNETVVEKRNLLVFPSRKHRHEYMVFRRPLRRRGLSLDQQMKSQRIKTASVADSTDLKSRINALILDETSRATAKSQHHERVVTPFDIIRSKLN